MPRVRLRVVGGGHIEVRDGVPRTRGDCVDGPRPCPYVRCRYHLWLNVTEPHWNSPSGKPQRPTTLDARWLESPLPPSCALDVADAVPPGEVLPYDELGKLMHRHPSFIELLVTRIRRRAAKGGAGCPE